MRAPPAVLNIYMYIYIYMQGINSQLPRTSEKSFRKLWLTLVFSVTKLACSRIRIILYPTGKTFTGQVTRKGFPCNLTKNTDAPASLFGFRK